MTVIVGIDPGKLGGIAWVINGHVHAQGMPETERDLADLFALFNTIDVAFAYLEKVGALPGQGSTSGFTFGTGYGFLRACLVCNKIPFDDVLPQTWQKKFGLIMPCPRREGETEKQHKARKAAIKAKKKKQTRAKAQQLFPNMKITHGTADALLVMEYGRRQPIHCPTPEE